MWVTEGEDKPLQYPTIFNSADVALITKNDLAALVEFDWKLAQANIQVVRPGMRIFRVSAKTGEGMEDCLKFLSRQLAESRAVAHRGEFPVAAGVWQNDFLERQPRKR